MSVPARIRTRMIPILRPLTFDNGDRVYEPIEKCRGLKIFYVFPYTRKDRSAKMWNWLKEKDIAKAMTEDLDKFSWPAWKRAALKNTKKQKFSLSPCPIDNNIIAISGYNSSSALFNDEIAKIIGPSEKLVCVLYDDFTLYTEKIGVDSYIGFLKAVKGLSYGNKVGLLSTDIVIFNPTMMEFRDVDKVKDFGTDFEVAVFRSDRDIEAQVKKNAKEMLYRTLLRTNTQDEIFDLVYNPDRRKDYENMLHDMEEHMRDIYKHNHG